MSEVIEESIVKEGPDNNPPIDCQRVYDTSELFKFFVQYRVKNSEDFARALHRVNVPFTVVLPSLKPRVSFVFGFILMHVCSSLTFLLYANRDVFIS